MAGDTCQMAIHKKPAGGGLSAVGGNSAYTYYKPTDAKYKGLIDKLYDDTPKILPSLGLAGEPSRSSGHATEKPRRLARGTIRPQLSGRQDRVHGWRVQLLASASRSSIADVSDEDYFDACELTDLMGVKAIEMLKAAKK